MIPIISIVGTSDCGKTTLIEKLLKIFNEKNLRVATIKHDVHGFDVDKEGKDTHRHKQAGAYAVIISSPWKYALISDVEKELTLDQLVFKLATDVDLILTEGFKSANKPKIEIFRKGHTDKLLCKNDPTLIGVATDDFDNPELKGVKNIFDLNKPEEIADFLIEHYVEKKKRKIAITVDGKPVHMKDFVADIVSSTISSMIKALKGCENAKEILIKMKDE
ncbi:molybdopterin-guanine dinucleotide biosynthesis protein B [Deferribacter autotrophicus]|uniref:Molybdopterin-guanine dinucleotide biosynthesis protein B n=1 Tax=Deferribacter autotrophicus TaxID=500465 RepID=A0A5A8F3S2_9BACT|nr:molybdopterin-guanine dinucleotide biosynthesis protein B [Deferribacter autotrophicus]KAA0258176.1 molybdopterin-guanine dinucleotide biosynthesis protein B [Deferribacter autotrophicus]